MSDAQVAKFIFHPGFSTAKAVTAVSGRGVGMDVVKTNIELIGGTVDIASERGRGTSFTIKIPLTLAIVAALIVSAGEERFAIPQVAVLELVRVRPGSEHVIERINGTPVLRLRERLLPVVPIATVLDLPGSQGSAGEEGFVVVTQVGREFFGILVDGVFHTEEIVVKPMSSKLRHIPLFSGNTILGDGAVVLIIDPNGIARVVGSAAGREQFATAAPLAEAAGDAAEAVTLLIFRGGGESLKAVPLSLVTRLEKIDAGRIEWVGGRPLIQYRGRLMPLVPADPEIAIRREGTQALVVFSDGERSMGLVVDEIVDIVDDRLEIELAADRSDVVGSAVIRNRATEIVNVAHYLPLAHDDWARPARGRGSAGSPTVLLVDDSAFFRELLTPVLKAAGYRVAAAESAERAMALIASGARVDLVVDRHRHAGDERLRPRRGAAPGPALGSPAGDRAGVGADAAGGRAGAPARHRRVRGEVRPQRPRRRACRDARPDRRSRMTAATESSAPGDAADLQASEYVTVTVADQMFGLADRPRARRLHRQRADDRAARAARDRRAPEPARPRRHRHVPAPPARAARPGGRQARDGGRPRAPRRILRPPRRRDRRGHEALTEQPRAEPGAFGRALDRALARRAPPRARAVDHPRHRRGPGFRRRGPGRISITFQEFFR